MHWIEVIIEHLHKRWNKKVESKVEKNFNPYLETLHIELTYAGVLEGIPSRASRFKQAKKDAEYYCGGEPLPLLILKPKESTCEIIGGSSRMCHQGTKSCETYHMLPEYKFTIQAKSYTAIDKGDGSWLVIVWYNDDPFWDENTLAAILKDVNWSEHAKDFWI